jgi:ABC-type spermidine/putrescine transport system permease subunit II
MTPKRDLPDVAGPALRIAKHSFMTFVVWFLFTVFVLGPLLTIVAISLIPNVFTGEQTLTVRHYARLFSEPDLYGPMVRSLEIAIIVVVIQLFFGSFIAFSTVRKKIYGARLLDAMSNITIALPSVVVGLSLLAFYGSRGPVRALTTFIFGDPLILTLTFWIVVFAHVLETFPYMVRSVAAGLMRLDPLLESAGRSLGAGRWTVFRTITLPQLRGSLVAGGVLVLSRSIAEFGATIVVVSAVLRTAPIQIYREVEAGSLELAAAYSVILMLTSFVAYLAMTRWLLKREREVMSQI